MKSGELVAAVSMPAGEGAEVSALALSPSGTRIYAAAQVRQVDTVFAAADISDLKFSWSRVAVICDLLFDTFLLDPKDEELIFATALGKGLYFLRPDALLNEAKPAPVPVFAFPATGHLVMDEERRRFYAGATNVAGESTGITGWWMSECRLDLGNRGQSASHRHHPAHHGLRRAPPGPGRLALGSKGGPRLYVAIDAEGRLPQAGVDL